MGRRYADIDFDAPIHWVTQEEYQAYFMSLPPDERWDNSRHPHQPMLWHWEERRWWALEEAT